MDEQTKFYTGNKVRAVVEITEQYDPDKIYCKSGESGTVGDYKKFDENDEYPYWVDFDNGNSCYVSENEIELIKEN